MQGKLYASTLATQPCAESAVATAELQRFEFFNPDTRDAVSLDDDSLSNNGDRALAFWNSTCFGETLKAYQQPQTAAVPELTAAPDGFSPHRRPNAKAVARTAVEAALSHRRRSLLVAASTATYNRSLISLGLALLDGEAAMSSKVRSLTVDLRASS